MMKIFTKTKQLTFLFVGLCSLMLSNNVKAQNCTVLFSSSINNYDVSFVPDSVINNAEVIWNYGDGSPSDTSALGNHTYSVADTFVVCLTINDTANSCTSTVCDSIIVLTPTCNSTFTFTSGTFLAEGQNGGTGSEQFIWNYGDGTPADTGISVGHTYAPGTYYVCLTTNDTSISCSSVVCDSVTILPPNCDATYNYNNGNFFAHSTNGNNNLNFIWDFGDGSPADSSQFTQHNYAAAGTYVACVTSIDSSTNCTSLYCDTIVIAPFCTSTFTYNNGNFNAQNTGGSPNPMTYIWNFGDSSVADTGQFVPHQFPQAGTYYVCLTAFDSIANCTANYCDSVVVLPTCNSTFTYNNGFFIAQNNGGGGNAINYSWDFGDTTTATGNFTQHNYAAPGTYLVCLTATDSSTNCVSVYCDSVVITVVGCDASFTYADSSGSVAFNGSTTSTGFLITYTWDFGDGQTGNGQNPTHDYTAAGTYTVCVTANDVLSGCSDSICQTIVVTTPVVPVCNSTINVVANNNGAVSLSAQPFSITNQYAWDFGDGATGTGVFVQHTYTASGTYNVCLTTTNPNNGCTSQACTTLVVTVSTTSACQAYMSYTDDGLGNYTFTGTTDATGFIINYTWDFGDGGTDNTQNPTHVYTVAGPYLVCFTVNDVLGACTDSVCQIVDVSFTGIQKLAIDPASVIMAPNPVKDNLLLSYTLTNNAKVSVEIYDILGKGILSISQANQVFGQHNNTINLSGIAAGSYILKLNVDGHVINRKLIKE